MEQFIREEFIGNDERIESRLAPVGMIAHADPAFSFALANVDDLAVSDMGMCVVEYKNVGVYGKKAWADGAIPSYYWTQIQWYMGILHSHFKDDYPEAFDHCYLVALVGNTEFATRLVLRDDEWFADALMAASMFWSAVNDGDAETVVLDGAEYDYKDIAKAFPGEKDGDVLEIDDEMVDLVEDYDACCAKLKNAEHDHKQAKAKLAAAMKDATRAESENWRVTWPAMNGRSRLDTKALKEAHPEIDYSSFEKQGAPYRGALKVKTL